MCLAEYVTSEDLYELLTDMAYDWKVLAEKLSYGENYIDEILINNETDLGRLHILCDRLAKCFTKEHILSALQGMNQSVLAEKLSDLPTISSNIIV